MPADSPVSPSEGALAYKLALAILSVLQEKGVLSEVEVDRVLRAAKYSASQRPAQPAETPSTAPMLDLDLSGDQSG